MKRYIWPSVLTFCVVTAALQLLLVATTGHRLDRFSQVMYLLAVVAWVGKDASDTWRETRR